MKPQVHVHIDMLVLHGFDPRDQQGIAQAVQTELTRLLSTQPLPSSWSQDRQLSRVQAPTFAHEASARAETIGARVAQSIHRGLQR